MICFQLGSVSALGRDLNVPLVWSAARYASNGRSTTPCHFRPPGRSTLARPRTCSVDMSHRSRMLCSKSGQEWRWLRPNVPRVTDLEHSPRIRLLLIDGHRAVADALAASISADPDIAVVATARRVVQISDGIDVEFNLALTRYILPDGTGADVTRELKQHWPLRKVVAL